MFSSVLTQNRLPQQKIVRKTFYLYCFFYFFMTFLSLKNDVNVPSNCKKPKN